MESERSDKKTRLNFPDGKNVNINIVVIIILLILIPIHSLNVIYLEYRILYSNSGSSIHRRDMPAKK